MLPADTGRNTYDRIVRIHVMYSGLTASLRLPDRLIGTGGKRNSRKGLRGSDRLRVVLRRFTDLYRYVPEPFFFFRRKTAGACLAVTGGIIWACVTLISGNPFPYLGQEGEKYFVYLDEDRKALPSPGSIITAGHTERFMPGKTDSLPDGKFILAAEKIPHTVQSTCRDNRTARSACGRRSCMESVCCDIRSGIYDMRAQGYYKFAKD